MIPDRPDPEPQHQPPPPTDPDRQLLSVPTRQSPVAIIFIALRFVRNLGVGSIAVAAFVVVRGQGGAPLLAAVAVVAAIGLVFMVLAWWRFVFTVEGGELLVAKGVVAQERLTIPLDRIQSVSINQRLLHRPIGLVSVSVDTAGSSSAELEIDAVDRGRAEALQRLAAGAARLAAGTAPPPPAPGQPSLHPDGGPAGPPATAPPIGPAGPAPAIEEETLVSRTPTELVKVGLARWPWAGLAALAPLLALTNEFAEQLPFDELDGGRLIEDNVPEEFGTALVAAVVALVLAAVVIGALLGVVLQVLRTLVTDWDLHLTRTTTGLRRTAGLFSTTSRASTLSRIQAVQTEETPLQRLFGIRRLTLPTIGEGDLIVPGVTEEEMSRIRQLVLGPSPGPSLDRGISPLAVFLAVRNQALVAVPITALAALRLGWWAALFLVTIPLRWLMARRRWRLRRWGLDADRIAERRELVDRHTAEIELIKTQTATVSQSFFERRRGLATVRVRTAEGHVAVPLIPLSEARAVRDLALFHVESDRRRWM